MTMTTAAASNGAVRSVRDATRPDPIGWLGDQFRVAGRHRPDRRRRAALAGMLAHLLVRARTMASSAGDVVLHVGAMICFTVGAFHASTVLGWLVAGAALIWTQHVRE